MFTKKLKKAPTQQSPSSPRKNTTSSDMIPAPLSSGKSADKTIVVSPPKTPSQAPGSLRPQSPAEQYWAARALKAETLLSARMTHHHELRSLSFTEETKRSVCMISHRVTVEMQLCIV